MKEKLALLQFVLLNTFGACAGGIFAVVWLWLFGVQLSRGQAILVVLAITLFGLLFSMLRVLQKRTDNFDQ